MVESKLKTQGSEAREAGLNFNIIKEFNVLKTQITGKLNKIQNKKGQNSLSFSDLNEDELTVLALDHIV